MLTIDILEKMKARGGHHKGHASWLRIYAIRLSDGVYIVTGGAIKLTATMQEREHTRRELQKIDQVRRFLLSERIIDATDLLNILANYKHSVMNTIDRLKEHQSATPSKWREAALERRANKEWLSYSQHIAMLMLDKMESMGMTQKSLAEIMGCSQQYVSKILKGKENLSLETLSKIESALGIAILQVEPA
jgi:antitoxin component HigA of HigAB toxin-antitoxin module